MKNIIKAVSVLILMISLPFFGGCAFIDVSDVALPYSQTVQGYSGTGDIEIVKPIINLSKKRGMTIVGHVTNLYGHHTADVLTSNDVGSWIVSALKTELEATGYIVRLTSKLSSNSDLYIEITVKSVSSISEAHVLYDIRIYKNSKLVKTIPVFGRGELSFEWGPSDADRYAKSLEIALQNSMKSAIPKIVDIANEPILNADYAMGDVQHEPTERRGSSDYQLQEDSQKLLKTKLAKEQAEKKTAEELAKRMRLERELTVLKTQQKREKEKSRIELPVLGRHWAVVVGLSKYSNSGQNGLSDLVYADDDAKAFANSLKRQGWSGSHIKLLTNEQATQRNVMIALESWLTKAGPDDMITLFWSGHGFPDPADPEKVYFACYDTDIRIPATGYRMDKVRSAIEELGCRNVVMFADTCHAGKLITRGDDKAIGITPYVNSLVKKRNVPKGWIFMVASDVDRKAIEDSSWSHGAFTHCLLKAMNGAADGYQSAGPKDGVVTMGELRAFMNSAMPDETQRILGVAKRPMITTSTGDPAIWDLSLRAK